MSFFDTHQAPSQLPQIVEHVSQFIKDKPKIVLVTSGGTTVPLEKNTVRFMDNFSLGTRGAASAEQFLKEGYSVIFMHRLGSLQPFARQYQQPVSGEFSLTYLERSDWRDSMDLYQKYRSQLLLINFQTVSEYLFMLRDVSRLLGQHSQSIWYLAAAVSDFHVPADEISEHKISNSNGVTLRMHPVPKILKPLVQEWSQNKGFIVSFKLETDPAVLESKSRAALKNYGHQVVIGNLLNTRKKTVTFYTPQQEVVINQKGTEEIEQEIVRQVIKMHNEWMSH